MTESLTDGREGVGKNDQAEAAALLVDAGLEETTSPLAAGAAVHRNHEATHHVAALVLRGPHHVTKAVAGRLG